MPINPNIALGAQPQAQPINMLGQMGQLYALKAAKQEFEGGEALREAFASGGDLNDPEFVKRLRAANPRMAMDIEAKHLAGQKTRSELEAAAYKNTREALTMVNNPESLRAFSLSQFNDPVIGPRLKSIGLTPEIAIANLDREIATSGFNGALKKAAMGLDRFFGDETTQRGQNLSHSAAMAGVGVQRDRLNYDISNPTQHFFTSDDNTLMRAPTRGAGAAAPVPMAGTGALPPQVTFGGRGDGTTVGAGSSIMVNPALVNGLAPPVQNGLITQPQPTLAPSAPGFAKVRQPPNAVTNVNTFIPASETAQTEFMKGSRATYDQLKTASTVLDNIEKAKALVPTAKGFMGTGGETMLEIAKFMNNRIGTNIDTAGIKSAEELNTRAFMGILDNLKKLDAQPSQQQQAALKQALGSLNTDPNAMNAVLDVFGDIVRAKVDIYNQEVTGAEQRGIKFPYNPVIKLPERSAGAAGAAPLYATNGKERIVSTDGGKTWKPAGAK